MGCSPENINRQMYNYLCTVDNITVLKINMNLFSLEANKIGTHQNRLFELQDEIRPRYGSAEKIQLGDGSWRTGWDMLDKYGNPYSFEKMEGLRNEIAIIEDRIKWSTKCASISKKLNAGLPVLQTFKNVWDKENASWNVTEIQKGVILIRGNGLGLYNTAPSYGQWYYHEALAQFKPADVYSAELLKYIEDIYYYCDSDLADASAYNTRGSDYSDNGGYDKAISDYSKAIAMDQNYALAYENRGWAYFNIRDYDKTIADCTKAVEIDPKFAIAYNDRGLAYDKKADYDKAISDFTKAIELDPNDGTFYHNRGMAYGHKEDYSKALIDYDKRDELWHK